MRQIPRRKTMNYNMIALIVIGIIILLLLYWVQTYLN